MANLNNTLDNERNRMVITMKTHYRCKFKSIILISIILTMGKFELVFYEIFQASTQPKTEIKKKTFVAT